MKPTFFLAGALALALVPGTLLLPGCGGGSGSGGAALPELRFARSANVEFPDTPGISGILTVNFTDERPGNSARAAGTLQLFETPAGVEDPDAFPDSGDGSEEDFLIIVPSNATYILVGEVIPGVNSGADLAVDLRGSYEGSPRFTVRGDLIENATISLEAPFNRGNSRLRGRLKNINRVVRPNSTPTPVATATPNTTAATTAGTTGATTAGTTGATTAGAGTAGSTVAGATLAGSTLGGGGTTDPPQIP